MKMQLKQAFQKLVVVGGSIAGSAMAVGTDYSTISGAADWTTAGAGVVAVGVAIATVYVTVRGVSIVVHAIRGR